MIAPWLFDNPILIKHVRSRLRRTQRTSLVLVVVIICGCLLWGGFQGGAGFLQQGGLFVTYFALQGLALHLSGMSQVASSIGQVNDSGVLEPKARAYAAEHDLVYIPPYNDPDIIAGQGTAALEFLTQALAPAAP